MKKIGQEYYFVEYNEVKLGKINSIINERYTLSNMSFFRFYEEKELFDTEREAFLSLIDNLKSQIQKIECDLRNKIEKLEDIIQEIKTIDI